MSEIAALAQALASIKTATDIAKGLRGVEGKLREAELKIRIADLAEALADARINVLDAQEQIRGLQDRVRRLEARPDVRANLERRDNVYYLKDPPPGRDEGPYCPACYESKGDLIPVTKLTSSFRAIGKFACPICQASY